jgi:hypothetical protein
VTSIHAHAVCAHSISCSAAMLVVICVSTPSSAPPSPLVVLGALVGGGGATEQSPQPPDKAKPSPGNQRAKILQLFLILLFGRYTSWSAESDSNARVKSTSLPFERSHFYCQRLISRLVVSLEILADQTPDLLCGSRRRCDLSEAGCDFNIWTSAAQFQAGKFIGGCFLSLLK